MTSKRLQLTLAIIKPDLALMDYSVLHVRDLILERGFKVVSTKSLRLNRVRAGEFYAEHRGKFFYDRLVSFMTSGPIQVHILARDDAIREWRTLMGPTKVFRTRFEQPDTIRGKFGLTDTRNCSHGSDSEETAAREIGFFFPEFDEAEFRERMEKKFVEGRVELDRLEFVHRPV